jgi:hypothetical protein
MTETGRSAIGPLVTEVGVIGGDDGRGEPGVFHHVLGGSACRATGRPAAFRMARLTAVGAI